MPACPIAREWELDDSLTQPQRCLDRVVIGRIAPVFLGIIDEGMQGIELI